MSPEFNHQEGQIEGIGQKIFKELKIPPELMSFLSPYIFDRGMTKPIPGFDPKDKFQIPEKFRENYNNEILDTAPVLSAGMARVLTQNGYSVLTMVDVGSLFNANQVDKKVADRLLREVALGLTSGLPDSYYVARLGGDEFIILGETKTSLDKEKFAGVLENIGKKQALYQFNGEIELKPISLSTKEDVDSFLKWKSADKEESLDDRVNRLQTSHPEIIPYLAQLGEKKEEIVSLLEDVLLDPILHAKGKEESSGARHKKTYRDFSDFMDHVLKDEQANTLVRLEIPGVLKRINDEIGLGYDSGNEFLQSIFTDIAKALDCSFHILRRGGDFFIVLPQGIYNKDVKNDLQNKLLHPYAIRKNNTTLLTVPCIPIISALSFNSGLADQKTREESFLKAMDGVDQNIQLQTVASLDDYYSYSVEKTRMPYDWEFLAYYLNPFDKRGVIRLRKLGLKQKDIDEMKSYYKESSKKGVGELNSGSLTKFINKAQEILKKAS